LSSSEANYSVTFVQGKPPMITVRADSALDWKANLEAAGQSGALGLIKGINDSLNGVRPAAQPAQPAAAATPSAPAQDQALPDGFATVPCGTCAGPTRFDKEGVSQQSGKPYKRYLCTTNQLHKATFTG
jgi:hypothetical protein